MSTRSTIWMYDAESNCFKGIYCHFDGYPEGVGSTLKNFYTDPKKVKALIDLGSISYLEERIDCPEGHNFDHPVDHCTVAYHRDRGEDFNQYKIDGFNFFANDNYKKYMEEYNYVFTNNTWNIVNPNQCVFERIVENNI